MAILNEEQTMLRDMAQEWVRNEQPLTAFRKFRDAGSETGFDTHAFNAMVEMGWTGVIVPEAHGGSDFGILSLGLLLEEAGRNLVATPLLTSALGTVSALALGGSEAQKERWMSGLVDGTVIGTLAIDDGPRHAPHLINTRAEKTASGWRLSGTKAFVPEGTGATLFVVAAKTEVGTALFLVPADTEGLTRECRALTDSRGHTKLSLENVELPADALLGTEDGAELIDQVLDRLRVGAAAELLGLSEQAFATTLEYLKTRVQFGQVLSSFQALQHRCAILFTQIELLRSAVEEALVACDQGKKRAPLLASLAKATACEVANFATREMIQLHGGIGMTDEHDAGFYIKRSRVLEALWGNAGYHRDRFARLAGY